jgi:hypothetical protein
VDFFVLCNNSPGAYFIVHCDVYQGKNAANIGIPNEIQNLPTTQKAVVNSIIQSKLAKDPDGIRCLFMDNRYASANLFILLREKFEILCAGTTRGNRIGWPKEMMTLQKSGERGTSLVRYDPVNKLVCLQWLDNKVVNLTSSQQVSGLVDIKRRSGSQLLNLQCEKALKQYQEGMDAVDRSDQYRERGAGFACKAHYKRWYKKAYFAILD